MLLIDWKLTLVTFVTVPVVLIIINVFGKKLRVAGHDVQGRIADITALLQEVISAIRVKILSESALKMKMIVTLELLLRLLN